MKRCICFLLFLAVCVSFFTGCVPAEESRPGQLEQPDPQQVTPRPADTTFESAYTELTLDLFQQSVQASRDENLLISPLSIQLALAMTANGADGQTRQEMEALLGRGISLEQLNEYLNTYAEGLPSDNKAKLQIANSIWFRDDADRLHVEEPFLQTNADYYSAEIYKRPFDEATVKEINGWVDQNTDGMINQIVDQLSEETMMYLINAIAFDAEWAEPYEEHAIRDGDFTDLSGTEQLVSMMHASEATYLSDGNATGFIKPYSGGKYSFAVLLPNEDVSLYDYINSLTADSLTETLSNTEQCTVVTQLPKFSYEYELEMNDILKEMGMPTAFDSAVADLTKLGHSDEGNLYIGKVLHKTFIQVDGMGTKAGAVTSVEINCESADEPAPDLREVIVDRPFVYMILDGESGLPIFIGCVTEITE